MRKKSIYYVVFVIRKKDGTRNKQLNMIYLTRKLAEKYIKRNKSNPDQYSIEPWKVCTEVFDDTP